MAKIQIRQGCFETNSSSTHALCIGTTLVDSLPKVIKFGVNPKKWDNPTNTIQDRADELYRQILYEFNAPTTALILMGKIKKALNDIGIECEFNLDDEYLSLTTNFYEGNNDIVNAITERPENIIHYLFSNDSFDRCEDNDWVYRQGGWGEVEDITKGEMFYFNE